jgi:hypothetical protein
VWGPPSCEELLCGCCVGVVNLTFSISVILRGIFSNQISFTLL